MLRGKTHWIVAALTVLMLALLVEPGLGQPQQWETLMGAGTKAYGRGDYPKAENLLKAALGEAEKFGPDDKRVATSLLAALYYAQGKYAEAEPLYKRSLAIGEKALGPEHAHVAAVLENYAVLLRKTQRDAEAEKLDARARAIRAINGQGNTKE